MRLPLTRREKEIWHACETLWTTHADLKKLTGDAIREQLLALNYKKGSPNEVYRYRKTWQETRGVLDSAGVDETSPIPPTPPTLPDPINRAVSLVRDEIFSEAQQTIDSMTLAFNAKEENHAREMESMRHALAETESHCEDLRIIQSELTDRCTKQEAMIKKLASEAQTLTQQLSEKSHQHQLALEKITEGEKTLQRLTESAEKQMALLKETMQKHQENLVYQLKSEHDTQIKQYKENQLTLKDLMESQRHQWIQQIDAEKTNYKKLQSEYHSVTLLLEKSTQALANLQEKSIQYEALMEIQQEQAKLLSSLPEEIRGLEKNLSLEKINAFLENKHQDLSQKMVAALQTHFQQQNEWLIQTLKQSLKNLVPL